MYGGKGAPWKGRGNERSARARELAQAWQADNVRGLRGGSSRAPGPEGKPKAAVGLRDRLEELGRTESPIRVGLVGAGQMGRGFVAQVQDIPGMEVVAAADIDTERALAALRASGRDPVEGPDGRVGRPAATQDPMDLVRSGSVDVVVEATGIVEVGARVAHEAILGGKHVVMLNVETDVTVGAILGRLAESAGVVYTGSAGDEPGAIMELYDFARSCSQSPAGRTYRGRRCGCRRIPLRRA